MQKRSFRRNGVVALVAASVTLLPSVAAANERHFTYTYESATLRPGQLELEPWTTFRAGKNDFYTRLDQRLEFEAGIVDRLQASLYWNLSSVAQDVPVTDASGAVIGQERQRTFEMESISNEWKFQLMDPVADALGLALYLEWAIGPTEAEIEGKVILDKRLGNLLLAANVVGENEWEFDKSNETTREVILEADLAGGYFLSESFMLGLEFRNHTDIEGSEIEHSAFFAGPVVSYSSQNWWAAFTILPQLGAIKGEEGGEPPTPGEPPFQNGGALTFNEHERIEVRLLAGLQLR